MLIQSSINRCLSSVSLSRSLLGLALIAATALIATPLLAVVDGFPGTVGYRGQIVDAEGVPLSGSNDLTATYFDASGTEVFREVFDSVEIIDGELKIEMGSGKSVTEAAYESLVDVIAEHPELAVEIAVDDQTFAPRIGILPAGHSLKSRLVAAGIRSGQDDEDHWKRYAVRGGASATRSGVLAPSGAQQIVTDAPDGTRRVRPYTLPVVGPFLSRPVDSLPLALQQEVKEDTEVNPPRHESLVDQEGNPFGTVAPRMNDVLISQRLAGPQSLAPALNFSFEGIGNVNGVLPPDTEGAVGPNHYIQAVNLSFAIYDKSGNLLSGPVNTNTLWSGFGGPCQTDNSGDAIFLYDEEADRFVLSQFAVGGSNQSVCFAVSQTPDPTGSYYLYEVVTPRFPDYYKVGVWPEAANNAYFFGTNSGFQGQYDVFAIDRASMLAGTTARPMQFFQNFVNLMMPADLDGYNAGAGAPPGGSPGIFYTFRDGGDPYFSTPPADSIDVWEFDVDWNTPANSTFTLATSITPAEGLANFNWTVCGFFVSNCIPQPGTSQGIDSASWWPMQRLVYRNFGSHEALVGAWTVDALATGDRAAPRWFELRSTGGDWSLYQQGTHSPDAIHRWMPSIAMDGSGNIALGYSRGDGSNYPSIYYTTRLAGDALGTLDAEALLHAGSGSQTHSAARWGDYASMELDPADDCTFWYTTEYLSTTSSASWRTRVGTFTVPGCGGPPVPAFNIACTPNQHTTQQNDTAVSTCTVTSINGFIDPVDLTCSGQPAGVSCAFAPAQVTPPADGTIDSTLTLTVDVTQTPGVFDFSIEGSSGATVKTAAMNLEVIPEGASGPQNAVYDSGLGAPACAIAGSPCDSTTLLDSRGALTPPEPNQPNTLDTCTDGSTGSYHSDESNDRIIVSTLDGGNFTEGDTVEIAATVWAWNTGSADSLDLYYTADASSPSWTYITTLTPPAGGSQTLTAQYVLPAGGLQAVRANFRYQGTQSSCSGGSYDDTDDLVFAVEPLSPGCTLDAECDDGAFCNGVETCNVPSGTCQAGTATVCDDGAFCNGAETCNETTDTCDPGTPPAIDDGVGCTDDSCDEVNDVVLNSPNDSLCDNNLFCDGTEICDINLDCQPGTAPSVDDGIACTDDSCDEANDLVVNTINDANCDNGEFCDGSETCDAASDCQPGIAPSADDSVACTDDSCDEVNDVIVNTTNDANCDNGQFCDGTEICDIALDCQPGTAPSTDDGVLCTDDSCDEVNDAIVNTANNANCDNGAFCDGTETCDAVNDCQPGTAPSIDDGVGCTVDSCNEGTDSIDHTPNDSLCDNGDFCDGTETCDAVNDCQIGTDPCPGQSCDEGTDACVACLVDADCNNGLFCDGTEVCNAGVCEAGTPPVCDDGLFCNGTETCNEGTDSCDAGIAPVCDDGAFCNGTETCNETTDSCDAGTPVNCADGVSCTVDSCNEGTDSCDFAPNDSLCDNSLFCDGNETCDAVLDCQAGTAPVTDDGVGCTIDSCNEGTDSIDHAPDDSLCDNDQFCDGVEVCDPVADCQVGSDPCPGQSCDEGADICVVEAIAQLESSTMTAGALPVTVTLANSYVSPVVVATVHYANNTTPVVTRVSNVTSNSFDVWLQNPSGGAVTDDTITYLVVEEGTWTIDGVAVEAQTYLSTVTDENNSWVGEAQSYNQAYTNPVVLGQVMSAFDTNFSVFWNQGTARTNPPIATALTTGKTVCEDSIVARANETVGFIVIEAGHGNIAGVEFEAATGADTVAGVANAPPYSYTFASPFASAPTVANLQIAGVDGVNGGWAQIHGSTPATASLLFLSIDEDQIQDSERSHTTEQVAYAVFAGPVVYPPAPCAFDSDCDDGLYCNGAETCDAGSGTCQPGTAPVCDDGQFCNGTETCNESADSCDAGTSPVIDDGVGCTEDSCDEVNDVVVNAPNDANCDDGLFCNGAETCSAVSDCQAGIDPCPGQSCDEGGDICLGGEDTGIWMSFRSNTAVPGVGTVTDEDIVSYDEASGLWALEFDGSDVGLGSLEISGLAVLPSGDLLMSFTAAGSVGGLSVDDSDIVRFTPTSMGATTAGSFSLYFDGSDVGLTSNGEDVDGIGFAADGRLIVSTVGNSSLNGASGADEDLFIFTGTLGPNTSGSFVKYFDGSDVGLSSSSNEDVDAATFTLTGSLLFSTIGDFSVAGLSGTDEDVAQFTGSYGSTTSGSFASRLDLSTLGIASGEDIGSLHIIE